jgi:hypothetical protein
MKVIFSDLAIETLSEIVEFLLINRTEKEISVMENDIESFVQNVQAQFKLTLFPNMIKIFVKH